MNVDTINKINSYCQLGANILGVAYLAATVAFIGKVAWDVHQDAKAQKLEYEKIVEKVDNAIGNAK